MPFEILNQNDLTYRDFQMGYQMELNYFPVHMVSSADTVYAWYLKNPYTMIAARDKIKKQLVGTINVLPLNDSLFNEMCAGRLVDTDLSAQNIQTYQNNHTYHLYFSSICVHPLYQKKSVLLFHVLFKAFLSDLIQLANRHIYISDLCADTITVHGQKLCRLLGLKEIKKSAHESHIFSKKLYEKGDSKDSYLFKINDMAKRVGIKDLPNI